MPKGTLAQELAAAQARVADLQRKALARNKDLASLPKRFGYETPSGLLSGMIAAQRALAVSATPVATMGRKHGTRAKAKPADATAPAAPAPIVPATKPAPVAPGVSKLPSAMAKATGQVQRVKVTPALKEKIRELTKEKKTVSQISDITGLGMSTLFRVRAKLGIKTTQAPVKAGVVAKAKPAGKAKKPARAPKAKAKPAPKPKAAAKPLGVAKARVVAKAKPAPAKKPAPKAKAKPAKKALKKKK